MNRRRNDTILMKKLMTLCILALFVLSGILSTTAAKPEAPEFAESREANESEGIGGYDLSNQYSLEIPNEISVSTADNAHMWDHVETQDDNDTAEIREPMAVSEIVIENSSTSNPYAPEAELDRNPSREIHDQRAVDTQSEEERLSLFPSSEIAIGTRSSEATEIQDTVPERNWPVPLSASGASEPEPLGSISIVFSENFEGSFPGTKWWVGDTNSNSGYDYWDDTSYRDHGGSWSAWSAQVGDNSYYGGKNYQIHRYDNNMDAYMLKRYTVNMASWDAGYVDFYAWSNTESGYDYLVAEWYDGSVWRKDSSKKIQGTSGWTHYYWQIPYYRLISSGAFGFNFHSDGSICSYEGTYIDDIMLVRIDATIESSSYFTPTSLYPGGSFTLHYRIHNPAPFSLSAGLGASIYSSGAGYISDPPHDKIVTISPGYSWKSRTFTVPTSAPPGTYDVIFGLWSGTPGDTGNGNRQWSTLTKGGALTVLRRPDLMWTNIWTSPGSPTGGQSATIYHRLKNQGGSTSETFKNHFYIDGNYQGSGQNSGLGSGSTFDWHYDRTLGPGYHTLQARADVYDDVKESDEGNNNHQEKPWWKGPDLIVTEIWWIDCYGSQDGSITSGQPVDLYWKIKNSGDATAQGTFRTELRISGYGSFAYYDKTNLAAGWSVSIGPWEVVLSDLGSNTITASVDTGRVIAEANKDTGSGTGTGETNNALSESIYINNAKWTVLVYMDGDNDLEGYMIRDFNSIKEVGSTADMSIAIQLDRTPGYDSSHGDWKDTKRFFVERGTTPDPSNSIQNLGEKNMGNPNTLIDFVTWGIGRYKANRYLVVLQDHGGSWVGCCWDDTSGGDRLDQSDLKSAFSSIKSTLGRRVDVLWFNDCLMSSIEVSVQLYPYVDYLAGSETIGWTDSWPYHTGQNNGILDALRNSPTMTPRTLTIKITELATPHDSEYYVTQSVSSIDAGRIQDLKVTVNLLADSLMSGFAAYKSEIRSARASSNWMRGPGGGNTDELIDLYEFASQIKSRVPDPTIQGYAQSIMNKIGPSGGGVGYVIMKERHTTHANFAHGLSIYFPSQESKYDASYTTNSDFTSSTKWDEFLETYYDEAPPHSLGILINGGATYTNSRTVALTLSAGDDESGVKDMSFSNDGVSWSSWESFSSSKSWTLSSGDGTKYVYFRVRDYAGNTPTPVHDTIILDTVAPTNPDDYTSSHTIYVWSNDNTIYVRWSGADDDRSGVYGYSYRWDTSSSSIPDTDPDTTGRSVTSSALSSGSNWYLHVRTRDNAGNWASNAYHIGPFYIDTSEPQNPTSFSSSHTLNEWSSDNTIYVEWSGASDLHSGVYGYSILWSNSPTLPDDSIVTTESSTTSNTLSEGWWYINIRTRDNAGNWASSYGYFGPFGIDDDALGPSASNPVPLGGNISDEETGDIRLQIDWTDSDTGNSGISVVKFIYRFGSDSWIERTGYLLSGDTYYYDVPRSEWISHIGDQIFWYSYAEDDDDERVGDRSSNTTETFTGPHLDDDDTEPPVITGTSADGDMLDSDSSDYIISLVGSDDSGWILEVEYYYSGNPSSVSLLTNETLNSSSTNLTVAIPRNSWIEHVGEIIYWRFQCKDKDDDRPDDFSETGWSGWFEGGQIYDDDSDAPVVGLYGHSDSVEYLFWVDGIDPSGWTLIVQYNYSGDPSILYTLTNYTLEPLSVNVTVSISPVELMYHVGETISWRFVCEDRDSDRANDSASTDWSTWMTGNMIVDKYPPITNVTLQGILGENDWYVSNVTVTFLPTDGTGSGINYTEYRIDGGSWQTYSGPFTVTDDGTHTVEFNSVDIAGNVEGVEQVSFRIDKTPPLTTADLSGTEGDNGWYVSNVTVTFLPTDGTGS
ncbi:MAG: hypothetical protein E3J35_07335, partial [Methanomassiliicoccales archaeon]